MVAEVLFGSVNGCEQVIFIEQEALKHVDATLLQQQALIILQHRF